ncbi:MAG: DinB family protein [Anaerolineae bacterium]|nr:DinB family protein [Anaerolineae bacterium]
MNRKEINEKIEQYGRGFDLLIATLIDIPAEARSTRPEPNEWSVHEIILHIADSEAMSAIRARKLIAEPGSTLMGYEESNWADALNYKDQNAEDALEIIKFARQSTYNLLKRQPDDVFTHSVIHPEYPDKPYTFEKWLNIYAQHIPDHIEQINATYQTWKDKSQ